MAEVNEEILEQYLKIVKRWFCVTDIPFAVPHNYSNIDVLAFDPVARAYYDFEVKFRSRYSLTNNQNSTDYLVAQFHKYYAQRNKALAEYIDRKKAKRVLVTTYQMMGRSLQKRSEMERRFKFNMRALGYRCDVWYFDELIPELVRNVSSAGKYNTQLLQTIRMLKIYDTA